MGKRRRNHILKLLKMKQENHANPKIENENSMAMQELESNPETVENKIQTLNEPSFDTEPPKVKAKKTPAKRKTTAKKTPTRRKKSNSSK